MIEMFIKTAIVPLVIGFLLPVALSKLKIGGDALQRGGLLAGLTAWLGFSVGYIGIAGFPEIPPTLVQDWMPLIGLTGLIVAIFFSGLDFSIRLGLGAVLGLLTIWLHFRPLLDYWSEGLNPWLLGGIIFALWMAVWASWEAQSEAADGGEWWLFAVLTATGASLVAVMDGSASIGQYAGSLAATCGALFLARFLVPKLSSGTVFHAPFLLIWLCVLLNARFYAEAQVIAVLLVSLAPMAIWITKLKAFKQAGLVVRTLMLCGVAAIPIAAALVLLALNQPTDPYSSGY